MLTKTAVLLAFVQVLFTGAASRLHAQPQAPRYPAMAPLSQYLMPEDAEVALARTAAPKSISDEADVMVLKREGYVTAAKGTNGFLCFVERSWAKPTDDPEFWNPRMRAPNCFNAAAAKTYAQIYLTKTRWVLQGKSKTDISQATASALDKREIPPLAPGAMCYMMSQQQYLGDDDMSWHPHLMFYATGDAAKGWGANLPGSPLLAGNDPEERVTVFFLIVEKWSDGTPAPQMKH